MRRSIALFLTLLFIFIVLIIISGIFNIYKKFLEDSFYKDISQNSILIKNVTSVLNKISKDINSSNIKVLFNTFPISSKDGNFRALITIKPLFDKVDINEISKNKYVLKYLENILEYYQIADPILFKDLILDTLDIDKKERVGGSEIILTNPFFKQGKIYNYYHLKQILNYYVKITNDKNIYKIPWRKLFFFGNGNSIIDCNLLSKQVAKFLNLKYSNKINCKNLEKFKSNKNIMKKLNIIPYNKTISYLIKININYDNENLHFIYDINNKRITHITNNILY